MDTNQNNGAGSSKPSESPKDTKKIKDLEAQVESLSFSVTQLKAQVTAFQKAPESPPDQASDHREVIFAQLHKAIFYPGLGQLPESMDTSPGSQQPKLRGLKMYATDYGLEVDLRGRTGFIPWGNVAHCAFKLLTGAAAKEADKNAGPNSVVPNYGPTKVGTATVTAK